jgi:4-aminobutyrate aminotransferase-like enzyme
MTTLTTTEAISPAIGPDAILEKKRRYLVPCTHHFYRRPPQIVRGSGAHLYDHEGRRYLDCFAGVSVLNVGHSHPEVVEAVRRQAGELAHTTSIYLQQPVVDLAERLAAYAGGGKTGALRRSFFCASGSEANEGAVLLAQLHTGRHELLALDRGLHGRTKLGMSLTGLGMWRADGAPVGGVHHAPAPYCYRCPLHLKYPGCGLACADEVERVVKLRTSGRVAAMIVEPVLGNGGLIVPPPGYFQRLREILDRYDILLIADEVQTGFGRTGRRFALEHWGVVPDVMTVAKALGGGLPIAAYVTRDDVASSFTRPSASTFGGNLVSCAAALAVLAILERERLEARAAETGAYFKARLDALRERFPAVGDVRGLGLMIGVELVADAGRPDPDLADEVLERLKDDGVLAGRTGADRNVLAFQPPLAIERRDVDEAVDKLERILAS